MYRPVSHHVSTSLFFPSLCQSLLSTPRLVPYRGMRSMRRAINDHDGWSVRGRIAPLHALRVDKLSQSLEASQAHRLGFPTAQNCVCGAAAPRVPKRVLRGPRLPLSQPSHLTSPRTRIGKSLVSNRPHRPPAILLFSSCPLFLSSLLCFRPLILSNYCSNVFIYSS